jgi:hypothetical protein
MSRLLMCIFMLLPLVALPVWIFIASKPLGILAGIVALVLAIPLLVAAIAHYDLLRAKSRYGLSDEEIDEFTRLVPRLTRRPEFARLPAKQMKRSAKQAAADMIIRERS